ncbi:MAG: hypothetical protein ACTSRA_10300, partial [Promethearchaeota archaeon]
MSYTMRDTFAIGLWFTVIGYFFLIFGYFLFIRYRKSRKPYWFYFSMFFIFLALSRAFYIIYDFYANPEGMLIAWRFANTFAWVAIAALSGIISILIFTGESQIHKYMKRIFPIIPLGIAVHIPFIPDQWIGGSNAIYVIENLQITIAKFYMNVIILPCYVIILPFMFFYLAYCSMGALQRSFFLNGLG